MEERVHYADTETLNKPITANIQDEVFADSNKAVKLTEYYEGKAFPSVYYFPPEDFKTESLTPSDRHTACSLKGDASYWNLQTKDGVIENAVWAYKTPPEELSSIKDHFAFDRKATRVRFE